MEKLFYLLLIRLIMQNLLIELLLWKMEKLFKINI